MTIYSFGGFFLTDCDKFGIISDRDVTTPKTYTPLSDTGGNIAHENRPPFFALYKLIKVI